MDYALNGWIPEQQTEAGELYFGGPPRPAKILIVEDEKEIRDLIRETLNVDRFEILESATGEDAWENILEQNPDLVLLDILLPGKLDGIEICRRIKTSPATKDIPVIFVTAVPLTELNSKEMKAEGVFLKPFSPIALVEKIYRTLGRIEG